MKTALAHLFVVTFCLLGSATPAQANNTPPTPTSAKGVEVISPEEANRLVGKAQFFDMRSAVNYGKGHIQGAIALPYDQKSELAESFDASKDKFDLAKLPTDKSAVVVFYSDGPTGWKSYKAAVTAAKMGYKSVKWMREGTAGWTAKGYALK
ncbi:MAG: rhodanese-like domain-containing protein [Betaproteobacteria bacterium]|nr:rhodanese-like domain-containing protein [Betaproteobacteria bacterium]